LLITNYNMKNLFKTFKILMIMLLLTAGVSVINAGYTPRPGSFSVASNSKSPLMSNTTTTQYRMGSLGLGKSTPPTAKLDVDGTAYIHGNVSSFGVINVASNLKVNNALFLNNITLTGKPGVRKLCASSLGVLDVCPPEHGTWIRTTPGSHVFDVNTLPAGTTNFTVEIWGGGGNSVPRLDSNPGNPDNNTNPADSSFVSVYYSANPTNLMKAENGGMGWGATTTSSTMQTRGLGGRGYLNGVEQPSAKGADGVNPIAGLISGNTACFGGGGGSSQSSVTTLGGSVGGAGGIGGGRPGTTSGRGLSGIGAGSGGGGFGRLATFASNTFCATRITVSGMGLVTPMSGGGGAGAHVVGTYAWNSFTNTASGSNYNKLFIELGEGGINKQDWMTGNGGNGAVKITW
jgi:hypothetical protein